MMRPVVNEERTRQVGNFPWLGLVLRVSLSALMLLAE